MGAQRPAQEQEAAGVVALDEWQRVEDWPVSGMQMEVALAQVASAQRPG